MSRRVFLIGLSLGAVLRIATLSWPGTGDVVVFKIWAHAASQQGVLQMYGVGGSPPERRSHEFDGRNATVNYPPVALVALGGAGHAYRTVTGGFANTAALTAAIKLLPLASDVGITWLLVYAARRASGGRSDVPRVAALAYWLNPGALMNGAVLGYLDTLSGLPVVAAIVAGGFGRSWLAGACMALGVLTKPQAALVVPAVVLAVANAAPEGRRLTSVLAAGGAGLAVSAVAVVPYVLAGAFPNLLQAMESLGRHKDLSANAANVWWIVTYVMRAAYAVADLGWFDAFFLPVRRPLAIATVVGLGYPNPRGLASLLVVAVIAWGIWRNRGARDLSRAAALGGWAVLAYFVLGVAAHENHGYLVLPLVVLAAALQPEWRSLAAWLSMSMALNLNAFYGLGESIGYAIPRRLTGLDLTVWLSLLHVVLFIAYGRRLARSLAVST